MSTFGVKRTLGCAHDVAFCRRAAAAFLAQGLALFFGCGRDTHSRPKTADLFENCAPA